MWVFGYGSLIWKVGFEFEERREGFIEGWTRRFWQSSTDHRGVPDAPGRVATLVPDPDGQTWGAAYRIAAAHADEVLATLDHREKGGYDRHIVCVRDRAGLVTEEAIIYIGRPGNPNWAGPLPVSEIAAIIAASNGPSGSNLDYLLELHASLERIGVRDDHVAELVTLCQ